jgi:hypothetical protein
MKLHRLLLISLLMILSGAAAQITHASQPPSPTLQDGTAGVQAQPISLPAAEKFHLSLSDTPPQPTAEQMAARVEWEKTHPLKAEKPLPIGDTATQPSGAAIDASTGTLAPLSGQADAAPAAVAAPGDFTLFRNSNMGATIKANTSGNTGEPNVGNSGAVVFATGNWFGAISVDGGQTFKYLNPATFFGSAFGGFCCDQHTLYDPSRDIFIWYLQYNSSGPAGAGQNTYRIAAARPIDAIQGNWWSYRVDSATNTEWDYPDMCLSDNYVYITTNRGVFNSGSVNNAFIYKWPLDSIATGAGLSGGVLNLGGAGFSNLSLKCTHGAREVMYFGSHNSTSQYRIFSWADDSGTIFNSSINVPGWNNGAHVCPTPDGRNWCGFDDGRMKTGWVQSTRQGHLIGFMWNASGFASPNNCNGTALSCPYIEAHRVAITDLTNERTYTDFDRPFLWITGGKDAAQYPAIGVNARGDLGLTWYLSSASLDPFFSLGIDDDYHRTVSGSWDVSYVRASSQGPADQVQQRWGDYYEVQPFAPNDLAWITTGQTLQGCGVAGCKETQYVIFGRGRDTRSVQRYYNPFFSLVLPLVER